MSLKTLYFRSDTWTKNTVNGYQLGIANSSSSTTLTTSTGIGATTGADSRAYIYRISIDVLHENGSTTNIGGNATLDSDSASSSESTWHYDSQPTFSCPETTLVPTDCIKITLQVYAYSTTTVTTSNRVWVSDQLNATKLNAANWTFNFDWYYYTVITWHAWQYPYIPEHWTTDQTTTTLYHGDSTYEMYIIADILSKKGPFPTFLQEP